MIYSKVRKSKINKLLSTGSSQEIKMYKIKADNYTLWHIRLKLYNSKSNLKMNLQVFDYIITVTKQ